MLSSPLCAILWVRYFCGMNTLTYPALLLRQRIDKYTNRDIITSRQKPPIRVSNSILRKSLRGFFGVKRAGLEAKNEPPGGKFSGNNRRGAAPTSSLSLSQKLHFPRSPILSISPLPHGPTPRHRRGADFAKTQWKSGWGYIVVRRLLV